MSAISTHQEQQLRELAVGGNKIAAIALYREMTGLSLKEAKDAVEAIMRGEAVNLSVSSQVSAPDPFLENRIKRLLAERKKIDAVKIYREAYHCGLKEAKDAVDLIQAEMGSERYSDMPSAPAISNDPFVEDATSYRARLIVFIVFVLLILITGTFIFLRGGF